LNRNRPFNQSTIQPINESQERGEKVKKTIITGGAVIIKEPQNLKELKEFRQEAAMTLKKYKEAKKELEELKRSIIALAKKHGLWKNAANL
jgi:hypothetical protein